MKQFFYYNKITMIFATIASIMAIVYGVLMSLLFKYSSYIRIFGAMFIVFGIYILIAIFKKKILISAEAVIYRDLTNEYKISWCDIKYIELRDIRGKGVSTVVCIATDYPSIMNENNLKISDKLIYTANLDKALIRELHKHWNKPILGLTN